MEKTYLIYMHTSPSGKSYIGQTCNLKNRNKGHQTKTGCHAFFNAIQKYGWDSFEHKILAEGLTLDEANSLEAKLIEAHGTIYPGGYNLRGGGKNGLHSEETKKRQSAVKKGKKHTPEAIAKISAASKAQSAETREKQRLSRIGKKRDDETKQRMAEAMRGKKRSPEGRANIKAAKQNMSAETREKISAAAKNRVVSDETREKLSAARKGKPSPISEEGRKRISAAKKGVPRGEESRRKQSESRKGKPSGTKGIPMSEERKAHLRLVKSVTSEETREKMRSANKAAWAKRRENGNTARTPESIQKMLVSRARNKKEAAQSDLFRANGAQDVAVPENGTANSVQRT